jgi:hypothetical protein
MTLVTAKLADWFRNPESSPGMKPVLEFSGGPMGGGENAISFALTATSTLQKVAYSNLKLGSLRGAGRVSLSTRFDALVASPTVAADRTKVGVLAHWNPARLAAVDAGYMVELSYLVKRIVAPGIGTFCPAFGTVVSAPSNSFFVADVGHSIVLAGAGVAGADYIGTVTSYMSSSQVVVAPAVPTLAIAKFTSLSDMFCSLRNGPDEGGAVIFSHRLNPAFGFVREQWIEIGLDMTLDTVGDLKLLVLARPNPKRGATTVFATYGIDTDTWYRVDSASASRYDARGSGESGWQILTRASLGTVRIGSYRAKAAAASPLTLLPDAITL